MNKTGFKTQAFEFKRFKEINRFFNANAILFQKIHKFYFCAKIEAMINYDDISNLFDDENSPESEGIFRAKKLQNNIIQIAEIAAECEFEYLGEKPIRFYKNSISKVISGKYAPKTLDSFMGCIDTAIYFIFGDIPGDFYVTFVNKIAGDLINLFVETYAYFLKTAFESAVLAMEEKKKN